jgi:hypothetical protein
MMNEKKHIDLTGPWTTFWDMHSGGDQKEAFGYLLIQAPEEVAIAEFERRYNHDPSRVTCRCCGEDYSISQRSTIYEAVGYHLGWDVENDAYFDSPSKQNWGYPYVSLDDFLAHPEQHGMAIVWWDEVGMP